MAQHRHVGVRLGQALLAGPAEERPRAGALHLVGRVRGVAGHLRGGRAGGLRVVGDDGEVEGRHQALHHRLQRQLRRPVLRLHVVVAAPSLVGCVGGSVVDLGKLRERVVPFDGHAAGRHGARKGGFPFPGQRVLAVVPRRAGTQLPPRRALGHFVVHLGRLELRVRRQGLAADHVPEEFVRQEAQDDERVHQHGQPGEDVLPEGLHVQVLEELHGVGGREERGDQALSVRQVAGEVVVRHAAQAAERVAEVDVGGLRVPLLHHGLLEHPAPRCKQRRRRHR